MKPHHVDRTSRPGSGRLDLFVALPRHLKDTLPVDADLREEALVTGLLDAQIVPVQAWLGDVHFPARSRTLVTVRLRLADRTIAMLAEIQRQLSVSRNALLLEAFHHAIRNPACIAYDAEYAARYPLLLARQSIARSR